MRRHIIFYVCIVVCQTPYHHFLFLDKNQTFFKPFIPIQILWLRNYFLLTIELHIKQVLLGYQFLH